MISLSRFFPGNFDLFIIINQTFSGKRVLSMNELGRFKEIIQSFLIDNLWSKCAENGKSMFFTITLRQSMSEL